MHLFGVVCDIFFFLLLFFKVRSREPRQSGGRWIRAMAKRSSVLRFESQFSRGIDGIEER